MIFRRFSASSSSTRIHFVSVAIRVIEKQTERNRFLPPSLPPPSPPPASFPLPAARFHPLGILAKNLWKHSSGWPFFPSDPGGFSRQTQVRGQVPPIMQQQQQQQQKRNPPTSQHEAGFKMARGNSNRIEYRCNPVKECPKQQPAALLIDTRKVFHRRTAAPSAS